AQSRQERRHGGGGGGGRSRHRPVCAQTDRQRQSCCREDGSAPPQPHRGSAEKSGAAAAGPVKASWLCRCGAGRPTREESTWSWWGNFMLWLGANTWLFMKTFLLYSTGQQYHYLYKMLGRITSKIQPLSRQTQLATRLVGMHFNNLTVCVCVCFVLCFYFVCVFFPAGAVHQQGVCVRTEPELQPGSVADVSLPAHLSQRNTHGEKETEECGGGKIGRDGKKNGAIIVHVSAHLVNVVNFSVSYSDEFPALNLARYRGEDPKLIILTTIPGVTGVLLVLILFLMFTSSSHCVRLSNYEIFWYTHNLFIVFYIILMVHMVGGALKYQTNIEAHPPGCIRANQSGAEQQAEELEQGEDEERRCREEAHFQPHYPQTWLWVSGPLCLYCAERFYRYIRSSDPVTIVTVIRHPCDVIELRMLKKNFKARPGQYIVLNCPGVSSFENHPFTLTTVRLYATHSSLCPTENKETFGIHLRIVGDWTERFSQLLLPEPRIDLEILPMVQQRRYPKLYVDGPFGSPSEEVLNYDVSVCVAGGIGVTPFACVLHALLELQSFYWFAELLCAVHHKLWQENRPDYFNLKLYVSQTDKLQVVSESGCSAVVQRASPGLSTDCVTQPDPLEQPLNSTRSPSADRTSQLVPHFEVDISGKKLQLW
ncbi:hypothetical protein L3Q82_018888, partial [Scortum barcoo]